MPTDTLEDRIVTVTSGLRQSILAVLEEVPGWPCGPQAVARALGLDKVLTSRLLAATRATDPLITAHRIPGPDPLRRLLRAAGDQGFDADRIATAESAVERFERLIRDDAGGRSQLDSVLSSYSRETRRTYEARHKQWAFKGLSHLHGYASDLEFVAAFLAPSADGVHLDDVDLIASFGLHRLRPGVPIRFSSRYTLADHERNPSDRLSLDGNYLDRTQAARLDQFCASPPARIDVERLGRQTWFSLAGDGFGDKSRVDLMVAAAKHASVPRFTPADSARRTGIAAIVEHPTKLLVFDVFMHRSIGMPVPELLIYDTTIDGTANPNDPTRDPDRLDLDESLEHVGTGMPAFRSPDVPNYRDVVDHVFTSMEWDPAAYDLHRVRIEYPVYGTQVAMVFDRPRQPEA